MIKRLFIVLFLLALVFGSIFGWKIYQQQRVQHARAATSAPAVTVSSAQVSSAQWQLKISAVGSMRAFQGVEVSSEVPGTVGSISFASGGRAKAGTVLVQLDATAEQAKLRSLSAQLELARLDHQRAQGLKQKTAVSQAQLDRAKSELESLTAQAEEQQALIAKKAIRAPFEGELGIRLVDVGEYVSPGTPIVTLQQLSPIFADFVLPERHLQQLAVGQKIELEVAAYPGEQFVGEITAISPKVESTTRNVVLQASLPNAEQRLRPGMFARINVIVGTEQSVLTLPRTAISRNPYGDSVFVIQQQGPDLTVQRQQVTTGALRTGRIQIVDGLKLGDRVVGTGQLKLRTGQRIQIDNSLILPEGITEG
ncbi:MAG: efflux RND transporter periplasmic adaptor subunit [Pseudomonadales bacterium]